MPVIRTRTPARRYQRPPAANVRLVLCSLRTRRRGVYCRSMRSRRSLVRALVSSALATLVAVSLASVAVGAPQQVLGDYADDGQIQGSYSLSDLRGALKLRAGDPQYGAYRELV